MKHLTILLLFFVCNLPIHCFAWSQEGHRITGEIAGRHLSPKARLAVASILGKESLAMASNYADFIKSDSIYHYLDIWHYIDLPENLDYKGVMAYLQTDTATDAYTKINFLSAELKKTTVSKENKKLYLKLLIHIVEDIHQPLHAIGTGRGGNDSKVTWFGAASNLHRVWDANLIEYQQLSYTEYADAIDTASAAQIQVWQSQPLKQWLYNSYVIGTKLTNEINDTNEKLGYEYNYTHVDILNQQLQRAGIDLAKVLNDIFK